MQALKLTSQEILGQRTEPEPLPSPANSSKIGYRKGSVAQEMSNRGTIIFIIYLVICTTSMGIMIYFLTLKCSNDSTVEGDNDIIRNQIKYDILSVDMSNDIGQKCSKWSYVGFEIFEILVLIIIILTLAYWL